MAYYPASFDAYDVGNTYRVVEWFMLLPDPSLEQAGLVSVMTGALTGAFGLFLGSGKKE